MTITAPTNAFTIMLTWEQYDAIRDYIAPAMHRQCFGDDGIAISGTVSAIQALHDAVDAIV